MIVVIIWSYPVERKAVVWSEGQGGVGFFEA